MRDIETRDANMLLGKPKDWDDARDGICHSLSVRGEIHGERKMIKLVSTWKPSQEELILLNIGGAIELSILSPSQPPVALRAVVPKGDDHGT